LITGDPETKGIPGFLIFKSQEVICIHHRIVHKKFFFHIMKRKFIIFVHSVTLIEKIGYNRSFNWEVEIDKSNYFRMLPFFLKKTVKLVT